jgi:outer membrane protein assembly factor BamE (lipoprotein component of BamABCDE complex)
MDSWWERDFSGSYPEPELEPASASAGRAPQPNAGAPPAARLESRLENLVGGAVAAVAILALLGVTLLPSLAPMAQRWWRSITIRYAAAPFFTPSAFKAIQPGMTADEVRDCVGYPLERHFLEDTEYWAYTGPRGPHADDYRLYLVVFDRVTNQVLAARNSFIHGNFLPFQQNRQHFPLKELRLTANGQTRTLRARGEQAYLVLLDRNSSCAADETVDRPHLHVLPLNPAVVNATGDLCHAAKATRGYTAWSTDDPDLKLPSLFLWKDSQAYAPPQSLQAALGKAAEADLHWLARRESER